MMLSTQACITVNFIPLVPNAKVNPESTYKLSTGQAFNATQGTGTNFRGIGQVSQTAQNASHSIENSGINEANGVHLAALERLCHDSCAKESNAGDELVDGNHGD
jgi:hypothetical protein